ncbi:hypothetical protein NDU88_000578 [Pleurodeles waltl]|uniref:Uncharacterized protein n=1 Tax=Pleurodeles waltl TaxID=8319 RepID=A0AAV7SXH9_PLEWA|nr:hypothetical protein NDU88_000578 [Pleurodeles waltl]
MTVLAGGRGLNAALRSARAVPVLRPTSLGPRGSEHGCAAPADGGAGWCPPIPLLMTGGSAATPQCYVSFEVQASRGAKSAILVGPRALRA